MASGGEDDNAEIPNYDPSSSLFSMKVWHNGKVVRRDGILEYCGGESVIFDSCDYDKMSIVGLDETVKDELGYDVGPVYYVKVPGREDLQYVETDQYLLRCLEQCLLLSRLVEVFCSHPIKHPIIPEVPLRPHHPPLQWHDNVEMEGQQPDEGDGCDEAGCDEEFRDSDYEQSEEGGAVNEEENLDGLLRKKKGKTIELDFDEGFVVEDSQSDCDGDFGTKNCDDDSDSDETAEGFVDETSSKGKTKRKKLPTLPEFNPSTDLREPKFELGLLFPSGESFKEAIKEYAIKSGKDIYFRRNEPGRVRALCSKNKSCPWVCYATKVNDSQDFMIKTYNPEHKCARTVRNRFATSEWLASHYADNLKTKKGWIVGDFVSQIKRDHVLDVSRQKAYRAKKRAETMVEGSVNEQFGVLWEYAEEIKATNPGSTVLFKTELDDKGNCLFKRIYICFAASKKGFNTGCRKLVGLDGCHLKGPHKGQLLSAVGVDANNSLFPIAYAVVESECKQSWSWFLEILREDIHIYNSHHWTFISDKQKGLAEALKDMWMSEEESAEHRHCARHVQQNFTKVFRGQQLKLKMMSAAMSCTVPTFKAHMEDIKKDDPKAFDWLMSKGPRHWCRAYFRTTIKCDILLNNLCETFNGTSAILTAREKPILSLLERIRMYILQRFTKQRFAGEKWFCEIGPRICKILERNKKDAASNIAYWCGAQTYQVIDNTGTPFSVDISTSSCSCKKWDLSGIPCGHAVACIWHKQMEPEAFVCEWYKKDAYDRTYSFHINPIRAQSEWPETSNATMLPPMYKKQPGRPKKRRRYEHDEVFPSGSTKMRRVYYKGHCKVCGEEGHNSRTCATGTSHSQANHGHRQRRRRTSRGADVESQPVQEAAVENQPQQSARLSTASPRFKTTARKQVARNYKTTARKHVDGGRARRLFGEASQIRSQQSQMTEDR